MKKKGYLLISAILISISAFAQSHNEATAIESTAVDYLMAWYKGDSKLMQATIHPHMSKKIVFDTGHKNGALAYLSAQDLLAQTTRKRTEDHNLHDLRKRVTVLDVYRNTATVKVDTDNWVDYLHLAKVAGQWKIVNILWELKAEEL